MAVEVNLPVRLTIQNLQEVINGLQNKLSTLKIGSAGFKEMQSLVSALQRNLDQLQVQTSKPFINQNQFNQAGRSITQLEDKLKQVQNVISRVKFDDLQLNPSQLDSLKEFENQIQQIKNSIRDVKDSAKKDFLASEGGAAWLGFSPKNAIATNQTLSQITASINSAFRQQSEAIEQAQQKLDQYKSSLSLQDKITNFTNDMSKATSVQDLSKVFGDIYQQIFTASGEFQSGGETVLSKWLSTQFQIDEGTINSLIQNGASKVIESLKNGELQALISSKLNTLKTSTAGTTTGQLEADLEAKRAKLEQLQPALNSITAANEGVGASEQALRGRLQELVGELEKLKQQYVDAARAGKTFTNDTQNGQTQLNSFRQILSQTNTQFLQLERTQRNFNTMKMTITNFMGFYQVLNLVKRGVREALNHIQELDTVMNKISIVTNMSTGDLWNQVDAYSIMAQRYGTSIKGAYEVSQIYYQQGLETSEVLTLTNETLKLAKISGLDYAATTDYMTTALRGFKMEASDAARVVDVYSNLAAHTAVSQEELAVAMSKTASSLESVGATFEEGSAMIGTMVAVTRESATNIGSALKSIAARYGEMKSDPLKLVDAEGDALAYNKVDAALQSVGITLKTTDGQFRNFTDVIIELGEKWNELDSTQQRYIATQFAGNRQQSRFLALVSNIDLLKANLEYAEDSEDTGSLQALKALDSIETKTEQVRVAYQQMYTTIGAEDIWKGVLDGLKNFMDTLNHLPKLFGKVPIGAIAMITDTVNVIKTIGFRALSGISRIWDIILPQETLAAKGAQAGQGFIQSVIDAINKDSDKLKGVGQETSNKVAEGAAQAGQDLNQPAGKKKTTEEVRGPATQAGENAVRQAEALSQVSGNAAQNTATIANNMERAANEAERATNVLTTGSATPTAINTPIETVAQINLEDLKAKIQEQAQSIGLNDIELQARLTLADDLGPDILGKLQDAINSADFSTPEGLAQFTESLASIKNAADAAGVDIAAAFRNAGDMGIAGLVQGLASDGSAVSLAGSIGQEVIAALKAGMGVASPSVPAHDAAQFVMIGAANGLSDSMNLATAKATEAGTSIIEAIRQALEQSPLDLKSMIQFIPPDFDFEKADLSTLDSLKEQIQEKLESIKAMIADETQGKEYAKAANSILSPLLTRIDDTANAEVKTYDKQLKNSAEYRAKLAADKEAKEINDRIEYQNSIIERSQYGYRYHTQLSNQLLASQYHKYRWQDATSEEQDAIRKSVRTRLADEAKEAETKLAELNPLREKALEKQAEAQAAFEPLLQERNAVVAQIRANQQTAKDSVIATFQGAKRVHLNDTLSAAAAPTLARIDAAREPLVEAEKQRQEQEAAERQRQEQEAAAERQRQEAVERQRQEYEATQRQRQEEAERQRQEQEAAAERQRQEREAEIQREEAEKRQRQEASEKLRQEQEANTVEYQRKAEFALARSKASSGAYFPKNPSREYTLRAIEEVDSEKKFLREVGFNDASLEKMTPEEHVAAYHNAGNYVRELSNLESITIKDAKPMLAARIQSTPDGEKQLMHGPWLAELYRKQEQQRQEQEAERQRQAQEANTVEPQRKAEPSQQAAEVTPKPTETPPAVIPKQEVEVVPKPAEGAATEAGNTIREQVQEAVDQKPVEVTPQQNTAESTASAIKDDSDIKAIQEKITAVEQLKIATDELANTQKAAQEYQDALTARREAAANARNFEGLENIKYNTSQKTIDAQIESSKGELEAAQNQQAVANAIRDRIAALEQLKTAQDAVNNTTKGTIEYENAMAERRAAAAEVRKFEGLKNISATTSQEVLNKEIAKSQAQLEAIPQTDIEAIKAKIEALEQLKAAQEAVNNTEKVSADQVAQKVQAQKDAIKEARAITGLGGIRAGISSSKIDEIIVKLKVQLDEATAKSAAAQAAEETKAEVENNPVQAQVTSDPATAEAAGAEAGAAFKQSAETNSQAEIPAPDTSNVVEANNAVAESAEQAAERVKAAQLVGGEEEFIWGSTPERQSLNFLPKSTSERALARNTATPLQVMDGGLIDATAARAEIDSLIEKLVELKIMGKDSAQELQTELDNMTPGQLQAKLEELRAKIEETGGAIQNFAHKANSIQLSGIGSAVRMFANLSGLSQQAKGGVMALGGAITLLGALLKQIDKTTKGMAASNPWMAIAMGVMGLVNGISLLWEDAAERLERLNKEAEELTNKSKQAKSDYRNLKSSTSKLDELSEKRYESAEAAKEYQTAVDDLASSFPELITGFDAAGNAIIDLQAAEQKLTAARQKAASAAIEAAQKEKEARAEKFKQTVEGKSNTIRAQGLVGSDASAPTFQQQYAIGDTSNYGNSDFAAIVEIVGQMQGWDKDTVEFFSSGGTRGRYTKLWRDANGINPAGYYDIDGTSLGDQSSDIFWNYILQGEREEGFNLPAESLSLGGGFRSFFARAARGGLGNLGIDEKKLSPNALQYIFSRKENPQLLAQDKGIFTGVMREFSSFDPTIYDQGVNSLIENDTDRKWVPFASLLRRSWLEAYPMKSLDDSYIRKNYFGVTSDQTTTNADWIPDLISRIRTKQGDAAADAVEQYLTKTDEDGNRYFGQLGAWNYKGDNTGTGAIESLIQNVLNAAKNGDMYNLEFFYKPLEAIIEAYGGTDFLGKHPELQAAYATVNEIVQMSREFYAQNRSSDATIVSEAVNLLAGAHPEDHKYDFIANAPQLANLLYGDILNLDKKKEIINAAPGIAASKVDKIAGDLITTYSDLYTDLEGKITKDGEELTKVFETMLANPSKYSSEDIISFLQKYGVTVDKTIADSLRQRWESSSQYYEGLLQKNLDNKTEKYKDSAAFTRLSNYLTGNADEAGLFSTREMTQTETNYFSRIMGYTATLSDKGYSDLADQYMESAINLFTGLSHEDVEIRNGIYAAIAKNNINTREGLDKIIKEAKSLGASDDVITQFETMRDYMITNLKLTIDASTEAFLDEWKDSSSTLKKITSGINFPEVQSMIDQVESWGDVFVNGKKFELKLSDFVPDGDKLALTNEKAMEYWEAYSSQQREQADSWQETFTEARRGLSGSETGKVSEGTVQDLNLDSQQTLQWLDTVLPGGYSQYIEEIKNPDGTVTRKIREGQLEAFVKAINDGMDATQSGIDTYYAYLDYAGAQIIKTTQWAEGNFSSIHSIYEKAGKFSDLSPEDRNKAVDNRLKAIAAGAKMTDWEYSQPDIKNAAKQIQTATGQYITDLVSKDISTLYAQDYVDTGRGKATIAAEMAKAQDMTALAFAQWIGGLAQQAGQTIEEQNDSFMKAWDKKHKKNTLDGFNGVQFLEGGVFQATDSQFKEFANTYELKLADLVESGLAYYNEQLGTWVVDYVAIDQQFDTIDFNAIPGFKETVADGVNSFFTSLGDLIQKALQGAISNVEAKQLQEYAERLGFKGQLSFMPTGKGLKLNTQSIFDLYSIIPSGTPQGAEIASYFKDYLIESDDRFKSVSSMQASFAGTGRTSGRRRVAAFDELNGNVDMYNRPRIDMGNGEYATVLSSTLDSRNFESDIPWVMNITPIPPDASTVDDMLSDADLDDYIQGILDKHPIDGQAILNMDKVENGGKGLIIDLQQVDEVTEEIVNNEAARAELLHEQSEAYEEIKANEQFNSTKIEQYEKELALLKEIQLTRSTSEDSSFKFMEGAIPAAQNNPLNYYENWGKAWKAIQTAGKEGYMSYQDFYNIATEMNNIAGISGQKIELAGITLDGKMESAAALIDKGAQSLAVTADGSIKIDLSKMGVDFAAGADGMVDSVDAGIKAMAQSQIDMLDGLIALMETIVAMESLKDIDVDGMGIDLTDIFDIQYDKAAGQDKIVGFTAAYGAWRDKLIKQLDKDNKEFYNEDLARTMSSIIIDGNSLADMIQWNFTDFNPQQAEAFTSTMAALYQAAISNNYDLNNIADSVKETLIASGVNNLVVDIGDSSLVIAGGQVTTINWKDDDSQAVMERVRKEVSGYKEAKDKELHDYIIDLMKKYSNGEDLGQAELEYVLQMDHHLKVVDGQTKIEWHGETFNKGEKGFQAAMAAWRLKDSGIDIDRDLTDKEKRLGMITTTATIGSKSDIQVTSDGTTIKWYSDETHKNYGTQDALLHGEFDKYCAEHPPEEGKKQITFEEWAWQTYEIRVKTTTKITDENGQPIDLSKDEKTRQHVKDLLAQSNEDLVKMVEEGADKEGNYTVTLPNGVVITLSGDDITLENGDVNGELIRQKIAETLGLDQALADTITLGITNAFGENGIPLESLKIVPTTTTVEGAVEVEPIETATGTLKNLKVKAENTEAEGTITNAQISAMLENASISVSINKDDAVTSLQAIEEAAKNVDAIDPEINVKELEKPASITDRLRQIATQVSNLPNKTVTVSLGGTTEFKTGIDQLIDKVKELAKVWTVTFKGNKTGSWPSVSGNLPQATGTVGNAMAAGGTLMGELGPELVVQKGRYFVAGQDGAEFVNLAPDAIVFNHLQTEQLLKNGMSSERGRAVTNERVAAAYAHGNMNGGPAMASASAALAALKQLRSMWQSLLGASVKDLAGAGGGGGGGGGGDSKDPDYGNFVKELEKWYNWLQKIAELEEEINYQESLRSKIQSDMIPHGENIAQSYLTSLKALQEEAAVHESLRDAQQKYFDSRRKWMNSTANPFSALYTFDENGQLKYKSGQLARLSNMVGSSEEGRANMGAQEQYDMLVSMGYGAFLKYDSEGKEIDFSLNDEGNLNDENAYVTAVQAFWDKIDADKEEMQSLHDSINEHRDAILESQEAMNEILQEIEDNQIAVEEKVLKAIEDSRQRAIDDAKDEKEAIEEASNNLIDGLSDQLEKERDMYTNQQNADELAKLQRQLAILQRSGGSATQIANLQSQISDKMQSAYFDAQQEQIDALKEATDAQLEKLDAQIELMEEQLAYEKEHGLLWSAVYEVMQGSPAAIANFIRENDSNLWGESPAQSAQSIRETLFEAQQYVEFRDAVVGGLDALINKLTDVSGDTVAAKGNPKTGSKTYKDTSLPTFDEGGMIDKTGVALVHAKEGVLTEEQTRILRRDILGHGANSLVNMLLDFKDAYNGIGASASMIQTSEPVVIEHAEVSMNVQQIANDYDAQRAGEQAFEKIMQIAKKTKGWNRIGR